MAAHLANTYDARHVLIFESFSHYSLWEPTFYGFPRYYRGQSILDSIERIPYHAKQMTSLEHNPIFIVFQWREYYLTPHSPYSILPVPNPDMRSIDYKKICRDPLLDCEEFTGFTIIRLKENTGNLALDAYGIIKRLLLHLPKGSWKVELHLAAAALARAVNIDKWKHHLKQGEAMTNGHQLQKFKEMAAFIRRSH
jgi:hypothetical protein